MAAPCSLSRFNIPVQKGGEVVVFPLQFGRYVITLPGYADQHTPKLGGIPSNGIFLMRRKHYLYHRVPDRMIGEVLYPLNQLASIDAVAANEESKKYDGRKHLMAVRLPILNCLWNDVVHLSPIHPSKIKRALIETGYQDVPLARTFFMIEPGALMPSKAVLFRNSKDTAAKYDFRESDFLTFESSKYQELTDVPREQHSYFVRVKAEGGRPLLWARTPHVFYQGEINIKNAEVVQW